MSKIYNNGSIYKKEIILPDANVPSKLSVDRSRNSLFFCLNADEFCDQSFQSVVLDLSTGASTVIPGIRNGFASAVDNTTGSVYLGGSEGIFRYNYHTQSTDKPAVVSGIDIFDMHFNDDLYFVDTANQYLYVYKNNKQSIIPEAKDCQIHHFVIDGNNDLYFANSLGEFVLPSGRKSPVMIDSVSNIRGATTDVTGAPYFIGKHGIYSIDKESKRLANIFPIEDGYGLAFDRDNNIIYSDQRSVVRLVSDGRVNNNGL